MNAKKGRKTALWGIIGIVGTIVAVGLAIGGFFLIGAINKSHLAGTYNYDGIGVDGISSSISYSFYGDRQVKRFDYLFGQDLPIGSATGSYQISGDIITIKWIDASGIPALLSLKTETLIFEHTNHDGIVMNGRLYRKLK